MAAIAAVAIDKDRGVEVGGEFSDAALEFAVRDESGAWDVEFGEFRTSADI